MLGVRPKLREHKVRVIPRGDAFEAFEEVRSGDDVPPERVALFIVAHSGTIWYS